MIRYCKNCGYRFEKWDKNRCPLCDSPKWSSHVRRSRQSGGNKKKTIGIASVSIFAVLIIGITIMNPLELGDHFLDKQIRESLTEVQQTIQEEIPDEEFFNEILSEETLDNISNTFIPEFSASKIESLVFQYTNEERNKHGKSSLTNDARLASIARGHSYDMGNRGFFDHDTPEGLEPTDRANNAGHSCRKDYGSYYTIGIAENIAQHWLYTSYMTIGIKSSYTWHSEESLAREIVDGWMNSPGHRENILDSDYDRLGVGISITKDDAVYATQNFC